MTSFRDRDFTLGKYESLCRALGESGYAALRIGDYLARPEGAPERFVLLRHDVETRPLHSARMAVVEQRHGLASTYFYRGRADPSVVRQVAALGHEVGYHYDAFSRARGNRDRAVRIFRGEIARLREAAPVRVASMHGSPLLPWDNREFWNGVSPADFGLVGEVYRDIDYAGVAYFSDTGRTWHPRRFNVRDHAPGGAHAVVDTTDELIALVRTGRLARFCLLTHPERWPATRLAFCLQTSLDVATNLVKVALLRVHGASRGR